MDNQKFIEISQGLFVDADFTDAFGKAGLTSIDAVFDFNAGADLAKANLAKHRSRLEFELGEPKVTVFLKRYNQPPILHQVRNWLSHLAIESTSAFDRLPSKELAEAGIATPMVIAYGQEWGAVFEKRSFIITQKIPAAEALERKLPCYFYDNPSGNLKQRKEFIERLADFAKRFHGTGFCHRDFYLAHIFMSEEGEFYLIDLQRAFRPRLFIGRFLVKDMAQLYYSAPGQYFSRADRLRFYLRYRGFGKLGWRDKLFIRRVKSKAWRMALHDIKHGRDVPFAM